MKKVLLSALAADADGSQYSTVIGGLLLASLLA